MYNFGPAVDGLVSGVALLFGAVVGLLAALILTAIYGWAWGFLAIPVVASWGCVHLARWRLD